MVGIVTYLCKEHVDLILQLLFPLDKERIRSTNWDLETGEPVLALESMAGNKIEENLEERLLYDIPEYKYPEDLVLPHMDKSASIIPHPERQTQKSRYSEPS